MINYRAVSVLRFGFSFHFPLAFCETSLSLSLPLGQLLRHVTHCRYPAVDANDLMYMFAILAPLLIKILFGLEEIKPFPDEFSYDKTKT